MLTQYISDSTALKMTHLDSAHAMMDDADSKYEVFGVIENNNDSIPDLMSTESDTVTSKSVAISNLDMAHTACHKHLWKSCLALVGPNIILTLDYNRSLGYVIWHRGG